MWGNIVQNDEKNPEIDENLPEILKKPKWAIQKRPPDGKKGAVGCNDDNDYKKQRELATNIALSELARQKGVEIQAYSIINVKGKNSTTEYKSIQTTRSTQESKNTQNESNVTDEILVIIQTDNKFRAKTHHYWKHPDRLETCVWMKYIGDVE